MSNIKYLLYNKRDFPFFMVWEILWRSPLNRGFLLLTQTPQAAETWGVLARRRNMKHSYYTLKQNPCRLIYRAGVMCRGL